MQSPRFGVWTAALLLPWTITISTAQAQRQEEAAQTAPPRMDRYGDPLPQGALVRLGTTRFRHDGRMSAVAYAADGKTLVTASEDQTVRRWDAVSGKELQRFAAPGFTALSSDGTLFVSIDPEDPRKEKSRTIRIWDTVANQEVGRFEWHGRYGDPGSTNSLDAVFSRDGSTLAVGSYVADFILLWDVAGGREIRQIDYVGLHCLALSPDGKTLFTGSDNTLWDVATGEKLRSLDARYEYGDTAAAAFSADGQTLALGGGDGSALLFDVATCRQLRQLKGSGKQFGGAGMRVNALAFSEDGKTLGVASNDWTVRLWDVSAGKQLHRLIGPTFGNIGDHGAVNAVAFSPDGKNVAAASNVPMLRIWDVESGQEVLPRSIGHRDSITTMAYAPDGKHLATASTDLTIRLWDASTGDELIQFQGHQGSINGLAFSPDGRRLISAGGYEDETLRWWDATTGEALRVVNAGYSNGIACAPDGKMIATAGAEGIRLWDAESGTAQGQFAARSYHVFFSSDGRRISDGVRTWELASGNLISELATALEVACSPDGKLLATAGEDGYGSGIYAARLLEAVTGKEIRTLVRDKDWICSVAFAPAGRTVAIAERTGIRLSETATGRELARLTGPSQSWYYRVAFSPDGRTLASVNSDTTVLIWNVPPVEEQGAAALAPEELPGMWEALASDDAAHAFAAIVRLVQAPHTSVPYLQNKIQPVMPPTSERLRQLIADLDDDRIVVRRQASEELEWLGELAESALRDVLERKPSLEVRERAKAVLANRTRWKGERLRTWRAIQVLEGVGTDEAQAVLKALATGAPESRLTQEAQAALDRLARQGISRR